MTQELVSVVMPVRDAARTVRAAVESVLADGYPALEVICVDDGSTDGTGEVLERLAARDHRVRVIHQGPEGIVAALERGRRAARGAYVARMDADDLSHPGRFGEQLAMLRADPGLGLVGTLVRVPGAGPGMAMYAMWSNSLVTHEEIFRERFVDSPVVHPTWMVRAEVLERFGGYRHLDRGAEDYDLLLRVLAAGVRVAKVPRVLLTWRDDPGRVTRTDPRCSRQGMLALKVRHLLEGPLRDREYVILGAGRTGQAYLAALIAAGRPPAGIYDINPRRIGKKLRGVRVRSVGDLLREGPGQRLLLACVAKPGGRGEVRALFEAELGVSEPEDGLFVA